MTTLATRHERLWHGPAHADCPRCGCHSVIRQSCYIGGIGYRTVDTCVCWWVNPETDQIDSCSTGGRLPAETLPAAA